MGGDAPVSTTFLLMQVEVSRGKLVDWAPAVVVIGVHVAHSVLQVLFIDCCFMSLPWLENQTSRQKSLSAGNVLRRSAAHEALPSNHSV